MFKFQFKFFIAVLLCGVLSSCSYNALDYEKSELVEIVDNSKYVYIEPIDFCSKSCFLFYPGGLVNADAYIKPMQKIAENGCPVVIIKATADLAIFNINRAAKVIADFPDIENWILGGHSLGGVVSVKAIDNNADMFDGLVLLGSYPDDANDLSEWNGAVLSISGENDLLSTADDINAAKQFLPEAIVLDDLALFPDTSTVGYSLYYEISGANHAQFGDYGAQKNDGEATITAEEQHREVEVLISLFFSVNGW